MRDPPKAFRGLSKLFRDTFGFIQAPSKIVRAPFSNPSDTVPDSKKDPQKLVRDLQKLAGTPKNWPGTAKNWPETVSDRFWWVPDQSKDPPKLFWRVSLWFSAVEWALVDPVEAASDEQELGRLGQAEPRLDLVPVERSLHEQDVRPRLPVDESRLPGIPALF